MSRYNFEPAQSMAHPLQQSAGNGSGVYQLPDNTGTSQTQTGLWDRRTGLAQHAFDQNQRVIPGLGIVAGQRGDTAVDWAKNRGTTSKQVGGSDLREAVLDTATNDITMTTPLSDGELEDIYEPTADGDMATDPVQSFGHEENRFASYSPQMSPVDTSQSQVASREETAVSHTLYQPSSVLKDGQGINPSTESRFTAEHLQKARVDARQAIMHLWPLNIRYESYIDCGVDKSILQDLFKEVGLALELPAVERVPPASREVSPKKSTTQRANADVQDAGDDATESRKDRIARLLAAKRAAQPAVSAPSPAIAVDGKQQQKPTKSIDKSKLLYEKMEALRRAREAKAQIAAQEKPSDGEPMHVSGAPGHLGSPTAAVLHEDQATTDPDISAFHKSAQVPTASESSSPLPHTRTATHKRPVASDFLTHPQEPIPKRPFSQTDRSRRFLIDVSDDDDSDEDTAMDLDTPEIRPQILRRNATEDSALRNHPPLTEIPSNGRSTPIAGLSWSNTTHGKEDLNRMQQDIEEMKRRIAEAEARKKAKQSRQGTPHQSPSNGRSDASAESPTILAATKPVASSVALMEAVQESSNVGSSTDQITDSKLESDNHIPELRRSLSRATLERLAVIEADRKRQTLKMKILRAQLAQMEREMAASLQEEKALRAEADRSPAVAQEEASQTSGVEGSRTSVATPESVARRTSDNSIVGSPSAEIATTSEDTTEKSRTQQILETNVEGGVVSCPEEEPHSHQEDATMAETAPSEASVKQASVPEDSDHASAHERPEIEEQQRNVTTQSEARDAQSEAGSMSESVDMESAESDSDDSSSEEEDDASGEQSPTSIQSPLPKDGPPETERERDQTSVVGARDVEDAVAVHSRRLSSSSIRSHADAATHSSPEHKISEGKIDEHDHSTATSAKPSTVPQANTFQPYESPLQYFHAYRFHPEFSKSVKGGLRSLTYSNKLDVRQQLCPDELLGQDCPRGDECDFQHLAKIATPDDQILMQLGSYGAHDGDQQEEFNRGLRKLLSEIRDKKIKDFQAISQAIIDYRAQFHHDRSKILPLGNVSL